jgi:hypothetical protein
VEWFVRFDTDFRHIRDMRIHADEERDRHAIMRWPAESTVSVGKGQGGSIK